MHAKHDIAGRGPMIAQILIVIAALTILTLAPPDEGRFWLVPLTPAAAHQALSAIGPDTPLIGRGPLPGSLVVKSDRGLLTRRIGTDAILLLAAPPAGCIQGAGGSRA
ncbi:hypothetical protein ABC347_01990 [Sphingomonas sp. 1P06PA]|uniref:hypothetical protein n=1 Tax=Sphingomonas sp. 1P06PA TaxID=554121 RepID=UPI0039A732D2